MSVSQRLAALPLEFAYVLVSNMRLYLTQCIFFSEALSCSIC